VNWQAINLAAPEFARPSEPPVTLGLFYAGKRHALSGPPEAAKTLLAHISLLEHMRGGQVRGAFVDFEADEPTTRLMLLELGGSLDELASIHYFNPSEPPEPEDVDSLVAAGVTFVVLDSVAGAFDISDLDDNRRGDAERFARVWIRPFFDRGVGTVVIDHVVKDPERRGRFQIGSERKLGTVDVHFGLEPIKHLHRGGSGLVRIATHKDRPGHLARPFVADVELTSHPETHAISWRFVEASSTADAADDDWQPTNLMRRVSDWLAQQTEPVPRSHIEKAGLGKSAIYVRRALDALIADGYAAETPGPRGARLCSHVRDFTSSTSSDLVSTSSDEDGDTSSDLVRPLQGDEVTDEDEVTETPPYPPDEVEALAEQLPAREAAIVHDLSRLLDAKLIGPAAAAAADLTPVEVASFADAEAS